MAPEKFRIAITGDYERQALHLAAWDTLGEQVELVPFHRPFESLSATVAALRDFDAITLMRERTPLPRAVLEQLPRLKLIVFPGRSITNLDYAAAAERGITVCGGVATSPQPRDGGVATSPPPRDGGGGGPPSELALALMLACAWQIPAADALVRAGGWSFRPGLALRGKTLGIVGYGTLGKPMARHGHSLGMNVLAFSRSLSDQGASADGVQRADLETLLRASDVISLHLPLTSATTGLIGAHEIASLKPGVIFINTARAAIVDQSAMLEALRTSKIAMAGLDVFDQEPLPADHPLLKLPNVIMTPHIGYVTTGNLARMYAEMIQVLAAYRQGVLKNRHTPPQAL